MSSPLNITAAPLNPGTGSSQDKATEKAFQKGLAQGKQAGVIQGFRQGLSYVRTSLDPMAKAPLHIFPRGFVGWPRLTPFLDLAFEHQNNARPPWTKPEVIGTFPIPGQRTPTPDFTSDQNGLNFPETGEFYLHTTAGSFKILILDKGVSPDDRAFSVAAFISRNSVHSRADHRLLLPNYEGWYYHRPDRLLSKFFNSDQPLFLHCGGITEFANYVLQTLGYKVRRIRIGDEGVSKKRHYISGVWLPQRKKWAAIDCDRGAAFVDEHDQPLSIDEVAQKLSSNDSSLVIKDIASKPNLPDAYQLIYHDLTWRPDLNQGKRLDDMVQYREFMADCLQVWREADYDCNFSWVSAGPTKTAPAQPAPVKLHPVDDRPNPAPPQNQWTGWWLNQVLAGMDQGVAHPTLGKNIKDPERWNATGKTWFNKLVELGLKPHNVCVDYGCGSLRLGKHLIPFLNSGNYWGVDITDRFYSDGIEMIDQSILEGKSPHFGVINPQILDQLRQCHPDFIVSLAVVIHIHPQEMDGYLDNIISIMQEKTLFAATIECSDQVKQYSSRSFAYTCDYFTRRIAALGGQCEFEFVGKTLHQRLGTSLETYNMFIRKTS